MQNLCCDRLPHPSDYHHCKSEQPSYKRRLRAHCASDLPRDAPWYNKRLLATVETGNEETLAFTSQARVRNEYPLHIWHHPCRDAYQSHIHIIVPEALYRRAYRIAGALVRDANGKRWIKSCLGNTKNGPRLETRWLIHVRSDEDVECLHIGLSLLVVPVRSYLVLIILLQMSAEDHVWASSVRHIHLLRFFNSVSCPNTMLSPPTVYDWS